MLILEAALSIDNKTK